MSDEHLLNKIEMIDTPDMHETFLRSQWKEFAAFAWASFLKEGRGAIVVDLKRATMSDATGLQLPSFYVAEGSEGLAKRGGWPHQEIAEAISDYDPELDVVFLVWRLNDEVIHYVATDELTPPLAYAARQRKFGGR
jgi:hypothetical protein